VNADSFSTRSFVLSRLLTDPVYREDSALWEVLRAERESISHYYRQIGQEVVIDEAEGYAFLRQIESEENERVPRIGSSQPLSYAATLLLVCLREELARFDAQPGASTRLVLTRSQMREMVGQFLRETNDETRDIRAIDTAIRRVEALRFVRVLGSADGDTFEVMRILKARFGPGQLEEVRQRLARQPENETVE
jgi:hypothetical protein